jgi:hypothetical protein
LGIDGIGFLFFRSKNLSIKSDEENTWNQRTYVRRAVSLIIWDNLNLYGTRIIIRDYSIPIDRPGAVIYFIQYG